MNFESIIDISLIFVLGILIGTLTMELGGKVHLDCEKTGYRTELEFKLKVQNTPSVDEWPDVMTIYMYK